MMLPPVMLETRLKQQNARLQPVIGGSIRLTLMVHGSNVISLAQLNGPVAAVDTLHTQSRQGLYPIASKMEGSRPLVVDNGTGVSPPRLLLLDSRPS
jgi:hypothetical protein